MPHMLHHHLCLLEPPLAHPSLPLTHLGIVPFASSCLCLSFVHDRLVILRFAYTHPHLPQNMKNKNIFPTFCQDTHHAPCPSALSLWREERQPLCPCLAQENTFHTHFYTYSLHTQGWAVDGWAGGQTDRLTAPFLTPHTAALSSSPPCPLFRTTPQYNFTAPVLPDILPPHLFTLHVYCYSPVLWLVTFTHTLCLPFVLLD